MAASRLTFREVHAAGIYIMERPCGRDATPAGACFRHPALNKLAWNPDQHFPHYPLIISQLQPFFITNSHANSHVFS